MPSPTVSPSDPGLFARQVASVRTQLALTQLGFSNWLWRAGVHIGEGGVKRWEQGRCVPRRAMVDQFIHVLPDAVLPSGGRVGLWQAWARDGHGQSFTGFGLVLLTARMDARLVGVEAARRAGLSSPRSWWRLEDMADLPPMGSLHRAVQALPEVVTHIPDLAGQLDRLSGFGARVRAYRIAHGLSQQAVAARLGVGVRTVRRWEAGGGAPPPAGQVARCVRALPGFNGDAYSPP